MKKTAILAVISLLLFACAKEDARHAEEEGETMPVKYNYERIDVHEVNGRQGVAASEDFYWVSGSKSLAKYDKNWNLIAENKEPFEGYALEVNHIGDIDVHENELYISAEYFMDGAAKNIQIAVYDADTLTLKRSFPFQESSGQPECSGIAVDPDSKSVWMVSWISEDSGQYLYRYALEDGRYLGKVEMKPAPQLIQGVAYYDGCLYLTADDGDADDNAPDHLYRTRIEEGKDTCTVREEKTFDDVIRQGEIEGLSFDRKEQKLLLLYNRGARIVLGMPKGFYEGYDREISEVFSYRVMPR